jgi:argininosuccinate lyase
MPQKKNPDVAELIRGKSGRIYGNMIALMTVMKGLPLAYNRDMQEDKMPVFDTVDTVKSSLTVLSEMVPKIRFIGDRMREAAGKAYSTATDIAEYFVRKGIPFRQAHEITGKIVRYCVKNKKQLGEISLAEFRSFSNVISKDIYLHLSAENSVRAKNSRGGTSPSEVKKQIKRLKRLIK